MRRGKRPGTWALRVSTGTDPTGRNRTVSRSVAGRCRDAEFALKDEGPDLAAFIRLAAATGGRRGELCALRWFDLDLGVGVLVISRNLDPAGEGWIEKYTKTHQARRLSLDTTTLAVLTRPSLVLARASAQRQSSGVGAGDNRVSPSLTTQLATKRSPGARCATVRTCHHSACTCCGLASTTT